MEGVFFHLLLWCLLGRSVRLAKSETNAQEMTNMTECFSTISNQSFCLTAWFSSSSNLPYRRTFKETRKWCKQQIIGSSLIIIKNAEEQIHFGRILRNLKLQNYTILTDARKISNSAASKWTWVTGEPAILTEDIFKNSGLPKMACLKVITEKAGQRLEYCVANSTELHPFICQHSGVYNGTERYVFPDGHMGFKMATWFDARRTCIDSGEDLASKLDHVSSDSIHGLQSNTKYWIGLHRNEWIWNSTGGEVTYTDWEGGYPDDDDERQCICLTFNQANLNEDPKWWSCNCNDIYPVICQTEAKASNTMATSTVNVKNQTNAFTTPHNSNKKLSTSASTTSRTKDQSTILSSKRIENTSPATTIETMTKVLISFTAGSSTTNKEDKGSSATSRMTTENKMLSEQMTNGDKTNSILSGEAIGVSVGTGVGAFLILLILWSTVLAIKRRRRRGYSRQNSRISCGKEPNISTRTESEHQEWNNETHYQSLKQDKIEISTYESIGVTTEPQYEAL